MKNHQVIYFDNGDRKVVMNVVGVKEGRFTHLKVSDGRVFLINQDKVNMIEVIPEKMAKASWGELADTYTVNHQKWGE